MIPKFRFFGKVNDGTERMVRADAIDFKNGFIYYSYRQFTVEGDDHVYGDVIGFEDCVLMQSTGVLDKNGKEIFEGDVLTFLDDDNNPIYENAVVKIGQHTNVDTLFERKPVYIGVYVEVQKGTATFDVERMYNDCEGRLTIIGNVYQNPELLEVTHD